MKTRILLFTIITMLIIPVSADAQVKGWLKKKAKEALKATTTTEEEETEEEKDAEDKANKGILNLQNSLMGSAMGAGDVKHKNNYDFTTSINMEMEIYDESDGSVEMTMDYVTYVNMNTTDVAIDIKPRSEENAYQGNMTMIYDMENSSVFMLTNTSGQKMAIATPIDEMPAQNQEAYDYDMPEDASYTKTGNTRTISGYKCEEYKMEDGESTVNMWVTKDIDFYTGKEQMKKAGIPMYYEGPFEGGMLMEMEVFENGSRQMKMFVTDINKDASKSFSMSGYTIMSMNMEEK